MTTFESDRMLSSALQVGNADVSSQGAAQLLLQGYRESVGGLGATRGPSLNQLRRTAAEDREKAAAGFGAIVHADYQSARQVASGRLPAASAPQAPLPTATAPVASLPPAAAHFILPSRAAVQVPDSSGRRASGITIASAARRHLRCS